MARIRVVLDACVLLPYQLAALLLRLADAEMYEPLWSDLACRRDGGRLHARQVVDVGGEPLGDRRDVAADLVELNDPQGLVRPVVLEQCLETLCSRQVLEGQRSLAAVHGATAPGRRFRRGSSGRGCLPQPLMLRRLLRRSRRNFGK